MLNGRHFLHVPGPTNIPERITRAMASTMEDQRGANFPKFTKPLYEDMKKIFKTKRWNSYNMAFKWDRFLGSMFT